MWPFGPLVCLKDKDFICVFLMTIPFNDTIIFYLVTLTLKFDLLLKNFNLGRKL